MNILSFFVSVSLLTLLSCGKGEGNQSSTSIQSQDSIEDFADFPNIIFRAHDDQTIIPGSLLKIANPHPSFNTCNKDFKIKIAVIDTGVDYNHPKLQDKMVYKCSEEQVPVGFGYDDLGNDQWASPYLVRTDYLNPKLSEEERAKSLRTQTEFNQFHLSLRDRALKKILSPYLITRDSIPHGTQVAALPSYDDDRIGILGYRPILDPGQGPLTSARSVIKMIRQAIRDGARVINLSLGSNPIKPESRFHRTWLQARKEFRTVIEENKNVIFVAATGNESLVLDFSSSAQTFPCGIDSPNVICVGSVNEKLEISTFSNTPINFKNVIYARGEFNNSITPSNYCRDHHSLEFYFRRTNRNDD